MRRNAILTLAACGAMLLLQACFEEDTFIQQIEEAATLETEDEVVYIIDSITTVSFPVTVFENPGVPASEVIVYKQYTDTSGATSDRVEVLRTGEKSFTVTQSTADLVSNITVGGQPLAGTNLAAGDEWVFTYEIAMQDSRLLTPLNTTTVTVE
ncbi:MAG: hypothetical protein WBA12_06650 [Catalinimonas sp.]